MNSDANGMRPPRLAEKLLERFAGDARRGGSIVGDAREEFAARRSTRSRLASTLWYWGYVAQFALSYREPRRGRPGQLVLDVGRDLRYAAKGLRRRPWMSLAVIGTLAIGQGAVAMSYALIDRVLLRPLPYPESSELVNVSRVDPEWFGGPPSAAEAGGVFATPPATFFDWERSAHSFTAIGAYAHDMFTFSGAGEPERLLGLGATSGVFSALAVHPDLGRHLLPTDDEMGADPVILLSHHLWGRRFGSDPDVTGEQVALNGVVHTIIGVMPADFVFPTERVDFWVSFDDDTRASQRRSGGFLHAVARLAPGVSLEQARAEMTDITGRLAESEPDEQKFQAYVFPLHAVLVSRLQPAFLLLLGAAAIVLLVGCANVTSLFISRVAERRRELAVHGALGAGRRRIAGLVVAESLTLATLGGVGGILIATAGLRPFLTALPVAIPRLSEIRVDGRILLVTMTIAVVTGLLVAVLPALRSGRIALSDTLRAGARGASGGRRTARARDLLVVSEVALAVLLLSVCGLFVQSFALSVQQDPGFDGEDVLTMRVSLPEARRESVEDIRTFFRELEESMGAIPGVAKTGIASQIPLSGYSAPPGSVETADGVQESAIHTSIVTPAYFTAMDIPVVSGRGLQDSDRQGTAPVVVVSQAMARRFWPDENPVGRRVRLDGGDEPVWREVVGVVGDVRYSFAAAPMVEYYRPFAQNPTASAMVVLKTLPGAAVVEAAVSVVHDLAPDLPVRVTAMTDRVRGDNGYRWAKVASMILSTLAGVATLLAILGVYSVLAHGVARRTREIGIRVALGGSRREILRAVLGRGLIMTAVGAGLGLALSLATGAATRSALVGVQPTDQWVLLIVVCTVFVTSLAASLVPAWRAVRVDPLEALRNE